MRKVLGTFTLVVMALVVVAPAWGQYSRRGPQPSRSGASQSGSGGTHRLGAGVHYWQTLDDIAAEGELDENGLGWLLSYQYRTPLWLTLEADLEVVPGGYTAFPDTTYLPQGYLLIGKGLYGGIGVGTTFTDGSFGDSTFYALRAGFDFEILPGDIYLDINANYRFQDFDKIKDVDEEIDTDSVTIGAVIRKEF